MSDVSQGTEVFPLQREKYSPHFPHYQPAWPIENMYHAGQVRQSELVGLGFGTKLTDA